MTYHPIIYSGLMMERYIDTKDSTREMPDFIKRQHGFPLWWLGFSFTLAFAAIASVIYLTMPDALLPIGIVTAIVFAALVYFTTVYVHNNRDIIMATEFQNALFAGAARAHSEFCVIVKRDGSLVYSDTRYNQKFSSEIRKGSRGLDALFDHKGITHEAKNRLLHAVATCTSEIIPFIYHNAEGKDIHLTLLIDPIYLRNQDPELGNAQEALTEYVFLRAVSAESSYHDFQDIINHLSVGFYLTNDEGNITFANETLAHTLGCEPTELADGVKAVETFIHPLSADTPEDALKKNFKGHVRLITEKLGIKHATLNQTTITYDSGSIACGIVTPFTKVIAEEHSHSSHDGWHSFIEHSPIAIAQLDEKGIVLRSNKAFQSLIEKIHCHSKASLFDILDNERAEVGELLEVAANTPVHDEKPIDVVLAGEQRITASLYFSRMENAEGNCVGILAHIIDTTEQKNLELRVVHSQKMQAVGQLAGGIAHDFNNLLTAMMGFCDLLLLRHPAGDPSFADIMQIKQNANRAANLVRQLLAFSRKQTLQPEILDITDVLAELSNLIRRLIGENIELKISHGRDLGLIRVDQGQLEQVLINLAVNARDAMADGGTLTIQTSNITVDREHPLSRDLIAAEGESIEYGDYVLVEVIDTGHGIPKDIIGKIFEPFFSTKEMGSGTGLGLATVYGIIKQTGGYVYVSSKEKAGTKFSIFLKSHSHAEAEQQKVREEEQSDRSAISSDLTGKGTLLLVEDEAPVRIFSAQALTNKGYTVLEADCGEAALEVVKERGADIDLIITDVIMPGMNGPSMVEEVAKQYPRIKVIFISGYAEDAFIKTYGTERKFNFLPKPFTLKQLAGKVKEVIEKEMA